jgi:hypothetical protein
VSALKELSFTLYSIFDVCGVLDPKEADWEPAITFFNERKVRRADLGGAGDWNGWIDDLDGVSPFQILCCMA